jgi:hypothetical protein
LAQETIRCVPKTEAEFSLRTNLDAPNFSKPFIIQCDASKIAIGAVLSQRDDERREHPVLFFNMKLTPAEANWTIHELEAFCVVQALKSGDFPVIGFPFTIETDHVSLKWMRTIKDNAKVLRRALQLRDFGFEVTHRSGKTNANADRFHESQSQNLQYH